MQKNSIVIVCIVIISLIAVLFFMSEVLIIDMERSSGVDLHPSSVKDPMLTDDEFRDKIIEIMDEMEHYLTRLEDTPSNRGYRAMIKLGFEMRVAAMTHRQDLRQMEVSGKYDRAKRLADDMLTSYILLSTDLQTTMKECQMGTTDKINAAFDRFEEDLIAIADYANHLTHEMELPPRVWPDFLVFHK